MSARSLAREYDRFMLREMLGYQERAVRKGTRHLKELKLALEMRNKMERANCVWSAQSGEKASLTWLASADGIVWSVDVVHYFWFWLALFWLSSVGAAFSKD